MDPSALDYVYDRLSAVQLEGSRARKCASRCGYCTQNAGGLCTACLDAVDLAAGRLVRITVRTVPGLVPHDVSYILTRVWATPPCPFGRRKQSA